MKIISRKEAKEKGLKFYFTGSTCKRGNVYNRLTSTGVCYCELCRDLLRQYENNRYANNDEYKQYKKDTSQKYDTYEKRKRNRVKTGNLVLNERLQKWRVEQNKEKLRKYSVDSYYKDLQRQLYSNAKQRAKKYNIPFNISKDDIIVSKTCPVFGIEIKWGIGFGKTNNSPSLDRVIPEKGYVKGNVVVISWLANKLKNNGTLEQLQQICNYIEHHAASNIP